MKEKNVLNIRFLYNVNGLVFNVGDKGSKERKNQRFQKSFGYASADNVKHCLVEKFSELTGTSRPKKYFIKDRTKSEKDKQGEIYTDFDLTNSYICLFGHWNPTDITLQKGKYAKCSLKSIIDIADMIPLHPLLVSMEKNVGVNNGSSNDQVVFKIKENVFCYSVEDLMKKGKETKEDAERLFRETRPMNFINKNNTSSGIYYLDFHINLNNIRYVDISDVTLSDEEKKRYEKENGYEFITDTRSGRNYCKIPEDQAISRFKALVEALFTWDFMSNNATHGSRKERLRTTISLNNTDKWQQATLAYTNDDQTSASLELLPKEVEEALGIYSYNTKLLRTVYCDKDIECSIDADDKAMKKIIELGCDVISNI